MADLSSLCGGPFRVHTTRSAGGMGEPTGQDSAIAPVPDAVYTVFDGQAVLVVKALGRILRETSEWSAANIGEKLHHAEWWITADPAEVERIGMHETPDCARCRANVDQALAYLADVGEPLLVGVLFWA